MTIRLIGQASIKPDTCLEITEADRAESKPTNQSPAMCGAFCYNAPKHRRALVAKQPIIPTNEEDPQGTQSTEARADNDFNKRLNGVNRELNKIIKNLPYRVERVNKAISDPSVRASTKLLINRLHLNASVYIYELSTFELANMMQTIEDMIESFFMVDKDGNFVDIRAAQRLWFMDLYVRPTDEKGTNAAFRNLSTQSEIYRAQVSSVQEILMTPEYQDRIGFLAARQFNEVKNFNDDTVKEARRVLSEGMLAGQSPRAIAKTLRERIDKKRSDAERLAATEVNMAHRTARWNEVDRAAIRYNVRTMIMHLSSFLPNVRPTHLARSGNLFTTREQREWYQKDANAIRCRCSSVETVVDSKGNPLSTGGIEKANKSKEDYKKRYGIE